MATSNKVKQTVALFLVTFLVSLIVITYFIKSMSPDVDVEIGGENEQTVEQDGTDSEIKQPIDDRLRWIQMEDNMPGASKRQDGESPDIEYKSTKRKKEDIVKQPESKDKEKSKSDSDTVTPFEYTNPNKQKPIATPPTPVQSMQNKQPAPFADEFKMSKVYVGSYPTIEQAIQAQNKIMNTSISVSPFVKEVNGSYVLQAGSYANAHKAEAVAREISAAGFPARVVKE